MGDSVKYVVLVQDRLASAFLANIRFYYKNTKWRVTVEWEDRDHTRFNSESLFEKGNDEGRQATKFRGNHAKTIEVVLYNEIDRLWDDADR